MPRPKIDGWRTTAKAPGSPNTGLRITGISSCTRRGSTLLAPMIVRELSATKKNDSIFGGSPGFDSGPLSETQRGRTASSTRSAMARVVSRL